jgi:hypothetical protein
MVLLGRLGRIAFTLQRAAVMEANDISAVSQPKKVTSRAYKEVK